jgi:hypothetical protein
VLLIIQSDVMPACPVREGFRFGTLLIAIFLAQRPVSGLNVQYRNTRFVEYFTVGTTGGSF